MPEKKECAEGHGKGACCSQCHVEGCKKRKVFIKKDVKKSPLAGLMEAAKDDPYFFLAPELREAKMLEKTDPEKARQITEAYWKKFHEDREAEEADAKAKRNRTGKYDPINFPLGQCRVCGDGDVVERLTWSHNCNPRIGGPSDSFRVHDCYYCKSCGIQYAFVPGKKNEQK